MTEKITLNSKIKMFSIVISDKERCKRGLAYIMKLNLIGLLGCKYYLIEHNKDYNDEGEIIRSHYHLVLVYNKRRVAKSVLNEIADVFKTNIENVQIQGVYDFIASLQYLIHKNDCNKYQYDIEDIYTNDSKDLLQQYINSESRFIELTAEMLIDMVCVRRMSNVELLYSIGLGRFKNYLPVIRMLRTENYVNNRKALNDTFNTR